MGLTSFSAGFVSSSLLGTRGSFSKVPVGLATGVSRSLALISRDIRCATIMPTTSNRFRYWPCSPMHGLQSQAGKRQRLARGQLSEQAVVKQNGKASEPLQTTLQASRACDHSPPSPVHIPGTCECDSFTPALALLAFVHKNHQTGFKHGSGASTIRCQDACRTFARARPPQHHEQAPALTQTHLSLPEPRGPRE